MPRGAQGGARPAGSGPSAGWAALSTSAPSLKASVSSTASEKSAPEPRTLVERAGAPLLPPAGSVASARRVRSLERVARNHDYRLRGAGDEWADVDRSRSGLGLVVVQGRPIGSPVRHRLL